MTANESMWQLRDELARDRGADKPGHFGDEHSTLNGGRARERGPRGPYDKSKAQEIDRPARKPRNV
jgi:hypothetical protein